MGSPVNPGQFNRRRIPGSGPGPLVQARFVTFNVGDNLYWTEIGQPLGTVLEIAEAHEFSARGQESAYLIDMGAGNEPIWFPARDLARNCKLRP